MLEFIWYILLVGSIALLALEILFCIRGIIEHFKDTTDDTDDDEEESTDA